MIQKWSWIHTFSSYTFLKFHNVQKLSKKVHYFDYFSVSKGVEGVGQQLVLGSIAANNVKKINSYVLVVIFVENLKNSLIKITKPFAIFGENFYSFGLSRHS